MLKCDWISARIGVPLLPKCFDHFLVIRHANNGNCAHPIGENWPILCGPLKEGFLAGAGKPNLTRFYTIILFWNFVFALSINFLVQNLQLFETNHPSSRKMSIFQIFWIYVYTVFALVSPPGDLFFNLPKMEKLLNKNDVISEILSKSCTIF